MKPISTRTHAVLDLVTAGSMLAIPRVLGCSRRFTNAVTCLAVGKLAYALMTRHELGVVKAVPMKAHLMLDAIGGATLCALPFLMDEDDPATVALCAGQGVMDIAVAPLTQTRASFEADDGEAEATGDESWIEELRARRREARPVGT